MKSALVPRGRGSRLAAIATAALACALTAGCLELEDTETLHESDERADIDGAFLEDKLAIPATSDPVSHEDLLAVPEIAGADDSIPGETLGFHGGKGEADKPKPGTDGISVSYHDSWSYVWHQGDPPIDMGDTWLRFCFLSHVQGKFEGGGEAVHVSSEGGRWKLEGKSSQHGVAARAFCIPRNYYGYFLNPTPEYSWNLGDPPKEMVATDTNWVCFLSYVSGEFDGAGEQVEALPVGGKWYLWGTGYRPGIAAKARCVYTPWRNGPYYWSQGQASVPMTDPNWWSCGLTKMAGAFEGGGEQVSTFVSGSLWHLGGSSYQSGVSTAAYCL